MNRRELAHFSSKTLHSGSNCLLSESKNLESDIFRRRAAFKGLQLCLVRRGRGSQHCPQWRDRRRAVNCDIGLFVCLFVFNVHTFQNHTKRQTGFLWLATLGPRSTCLLLYIINRFLPFLYFYISIKDSLVPCWSSCCLHNSSHKVQSVLHSKVQYFSHTWLHCQFSFSSWADEQCCRNIVTLFTSL